MTLASWFFILCVCLFVFDSTKRKQKKKVELYKQQRKVLNKQLKKIKKKYDL